MSLDQPKGLFSSLTLGRASKSSKPAETLTHPLLGASTSSLNLTEPNTDSGPSHPSLNTHGRQSSASRVVSGTGDTFNVPYKPRQRVHGHGSTNSISSVQSLTSPTIHPTSTSTSILTPPVVSTSPVTPTGISAPPITATSTSNTFALPPSATDTTLVDNGTLSTNAIGSSSSATSRLQLQSLKAAAQKMGLGNGTMGMSMIDTIFEKSQAGRGKADNGEWAELLKLISGGKIILLLPESTAPSLPITTQILKDHVAFISPSIPLSATPRDDKKPISSSDPPLSASVVVTLSGIVGSIQGSSLSTDSTLSLESPILASIKDQATRTATISTLRPPSLTSSAHFPTFTISPEASTLPFPPLNRASSSTHADDKTQKPSTSKRGRINPFASLFGGSTSASAMASSPAEKEVSDPASPSRASLGNVTPDRPRSPISLNSPAVHLSSPKAPSVQFDTDTASIRSDITSRDAEGYQITAYTISKPIKHADVGKSISKAIKSTIRDELHRLPEKVIDKVIKLVVAGACPTHAISPDKSDVKSVQLDYTDPTTTGEKLQEFIEEAYDDLLLHFKADSSHIFGENEFGSIRRKASWTKKSAAQDTAISETDPEQARKERKDKLRKEKDAWAEKEATEGTERVEAVLCRLLYNRLFSPIESDDARHDEALSSRIAALNMLDLSLDHLGLITRPDDAPAGEENVIADGLVKVVDSIGDELQKLSLPNCLTPREKADALIKAHKLVVDGLTDLPPIDLRPEGEQYKPPSRTMSPAPAGESSSGLKSVPSTGSVAEALAASQSHTPPPGATVPMQIRKSSSSSSSLLSSSPPSDPLTSIEEVLEQTPRTLQATSSGQVPQLVLPDSNESQIEEAMSDSVLTIQPTSPTRPVSPDPPESKVAPRGTTSGADLILPIIIYAVVKSNPPQLASQLMYLRRYRSAICLTGEASYAIVNLTAVVEFLEHVELSQLGLGDDSDKVISVEDLSPIGLNYLDESNADAASIASASSRLRGRVFQVGELAGSAADSANKVLTGVVDSSWTALRGLISTPNSNGTQEEGTETVSPPADTRPNMRPRQASTFSLASVTASVATIAAAAANRSRSRANSRASAIMNTQNKEEHTWKGNEEMVEVTSRPESIREKGASYKSDEEEGYESEEEDLDTENPSSETHTRRRSDAKSVKSVSSALSRHRSRELEKEDARERVSIGDRLASIGVLGRTSTPENNPIEQPQKTTGFLAGISTSVRNVSGTGHARRLSLLGGGSGNKVDHSPSPAESHTSLPNLGTPSSVENLEPPIDHFMTCEVGDIKLSEIGLLLRDYRRLGGIINSLQNKQNL